MICHLPELNFERANGLKRNSVPWTLFFTVQWNTYASIYTCLTECTDTTILLRLIKMLVC
jgi:hypothetical protein